MRSWWTRRWPSHLHNGDIGIIGLIFEACAWLFFMVLVLGIVLPVALFGDLVVKPIREKRRKIGLEKYILRNTVEKIENENRLRRKA